MYFIKFYKTDIREKRTKFLLQKTVEFRFNIANLMSTCIKGANIILFAPTINIYIVANEA